MLKIAVLLATVHVSIEIVDAMTINGTTSLGLLQLDDFFYPLPTLVQNPNVRVKVGNKRSGDDCTDEMLRRVMHDHISEDGMTQSKRAVHSAAKRDFEGSWSVICAPCAFSYLAHTQDYCIHTRYGITCLLYRDG
ncbi:unnamed protein product [Caenorhabditis bovis]|uniref:Ground-like domain-containing protein n=1 Tax=Caenorhabditis bovis TaxID=2654633 RepID=A0A8S1ETB7_9PELO|nr:unnamed protein product [Caenorhabditis bovis]